MSRTISVVVPFFESDRTFPEALASVLAQTRAPDEVIIVDDASAPERCRTLTDVPAGTTVIRLPQNSGVAHAREVGSRRATGEWIAYLDADDAWEPEKLARQEAEVERCPELSAIHCGTALWKHGVLGRTFTDKPARLTLPMILAGGQLLSSALMIRRDVLFEIGGWSGNRHLLEDWDLTIRLLEHGAEIGFLPEALTRFRREGHGNMTADPWRDLTIHLTVVDEYRHLMDRELGPGHAPQMRRQFLTRFGHLTGGLAGRLIRMAAWLMARRVPRAAPS